MDFNPRTDLLPLEAPDRRNRIFKPGRQTAREINPHSPRGEITGEKGRKTTETPRTYNPLLESPLTLPLDSAALEADPHSPAPAPEPAARSDTTPDGRTSESRPEKPRPALRHSAPARPRPARRRPPEPEPRPRARTRKPAGKEIHFPTDGSPSPARAPTPPGPGEGRRGTHDGNFWLFL